MAIGMEEWRQERTQSMVLENKLKFYISEAKHSNMCVCVGHTYSNHHRCECEQNFYQRTNDIFHLEKHNIKF